jgi:RNA polymerase sigma factor (sigma-70 family)
MVETPETGREHTDLRHRGAAVTASEVQAWFVREVLPLEAILMQYLHRNWRNASDLADLRQEVYVRVCEAAQNQIPDSAKAFTLTTARNLLINRVRREQVVPIEAAGDLDALDIARDEPGPDRTVIARDELRRLQAALDRLSPRSREAVVLGRIEGLSRRQIAARMGIAEDTVRQHLAHGMRTLADILYGVTQDTGRKP